MPATFHNATFYPNNYLNFQQFSTKSTQYIHSVMCKGLFSLVYHQYFTEITPKIGKLLTELFHLVLRSLKNWLFSTVRTSIWGADIKAWISRIGRRQNCCLNLIGPRKQPTERRLGTSTRIVFWHDTAFVFVREKAKHLREIVKVALNFWLQFPDLLHHFSGDLRQWGLRGIYQIPRSSS